MIASTENPLLACMLGTAVGDALGLPCEGMTAEKRRRRFGEINGHRLLFGRGMFSDDAEHTVMTAQALVASGGAVGAFQNSLARQLRGWILLLPGGAGLATLKACVKLLCGAGPERSGVFSAGNGPAMRAAVLGVFAAERGLEIGRLRELNRASSCITHTDPKAEVGALAVALAAFLAVGEKAVAPREFLALLRENLPDDDAARELSALLESVVLSVESGASTPEFCAAQGWQRGAGGYVFQTVPAALHAWLRHPENFRDGVLEIIKCGGDTDSTAAIVGGLIAARTGTEGIPPEWRNGLLEWPRGVVWMEKLAARLNEVATSGQPGKPISTFWPGVLARNLFFLAVVLVHGFRRLLPLKFGVGA